MTTTLGPVSALLESALREEARRHGIVVWLDRDGGYTAFADGLYERAARGEFPYPVRRLRGSYLELMRELDGLEDGIGMTPLIIHVPGHTEDSIAATPLYELYCAGRRYRRALDTLVREAAHGLVTPDAIQTFMLAGTVTLDAADRWLRASTAAPSTTDLPELGLLSAIDLYEKLREGLLAEHLSRAPMAVWNKIEAVTGMDEVARTQWVSQRGAADLPEAMAAFALCVEFVHDLKRAPVTEELDPLRMLPKPAVEACRRLAAHLREHAPDGYAHIADFAEGHLQEEVLRATAADLGKIDTFRFEDQKVMAAALEALASARYTEADELAALRTSGKSFWTRQDHSRRVAWNLIGLAATLGREIQATDELLAGVTSLAEATERYAEHGWKADRAHRHLEQERQQLLHIELEELALLRERLDDVRNVYRSWADRLSRGWNALARRSGFLPPAELQQRTLFEQVVEPLLGDEVTAYILCDALRYEMGCELARALQETRTADVEVRARLAELPTVTEVGMNVLAPVVRGGKLTADVDEDGVRGFRVGGIRIDDPEKRRRAIFERVGGQACPGFTLDQVLSRDGLSLRQGIARARVVVVHADGIDRAGEQGTGLSMFEDELLKLRAVWRALREAGVRRFVFTADHGFLIHDATTRVPLPHGKLTDPDARYAIVRHPVEEAGKVTIGSRELGYDGNDVWFQFPESTAPFDRGKRVKDFAHGGPTPQERVIPVITVRHRHAPGGETARYQVELGRASLHNGLHWLEAVVRSAGQVSLAYGGRSEIELALECVDDPEVRVEIMEVKGARRDGSAVYATVDTPFEMSFRLRGSVDARVSVRVRHATRSANVVAAESVTRFQVEVRETVKPPAPGGASSATDERWLEAFPDPGVRAVLRHLAVYGTIDEAEMTKMLGSGRAYRAFCRAFDDHYLPRLPFPARIETGSGSKLFVRGDR